MESSKLISVIVPVYNGEPYLAEALQSVLDQGYPEMEIIVVDDGSTDGTAALVKEKFPSVRYDYQENAGTGAARNRGIALAQGEMFAFLDADDYWLKEKLALQVAAFEESPDTEIVFGHVKQFHSPELDEESMRTIHCPAEIMPGVLPSTMLIKRDAFFKVGLFETNWRVGQDVNWIIRARELELRAIVLPDLVYMRRLHKTNKGITQREFIHDRVRILKASLDRRRAAKPQDPASS